jgi:hypothetical protein
MGSVQEVEEFLLLAVQKAKEITALSIKGIATSKELADCLNRAWGEGAPLSSSFMSIFEKALEADRDFEILTRRTQELIDEVQNYIERL